MFDDVRAFSNTAANVDKKLASSWINAPVLLAWEEFSELGPLIKREFAEEGDIEKVLNISSSLKCRTKNIL